MATNQKTQGNREDKNQKGQGSQHENRGNRQENQENSNENRGNSQETQGNSDSSSNRGFAAMDDEKQREIASKGGKAAHESGHAHEFDSKEAREAGRKGGQH
ncbi:MAG: ral stress protein [Mucilaginibacter sp.]|jgi:general stress protein YciG|nr:ral stress protein [Mucilaginibacter sp.]MDB5017289.1 ral stress protein [Mucilaginibacter sp.]